MRWGSHLSWSSTSLYAIFLCWNIDNVNNHHKDQHVDYLVHCQVHGCNLPIKDQSDTKKSKVKIFKKYNHWLLIFESSIFFSNMIFWIQSFGFFLQNFLFHHESLRLDDFHTFPIWWEGILAHSNGIIGIHTWMRIAIISGGNIRVQITSYLFLTQAEFYPKRHLTWWLKK